MVVCTRMCLCMCHAAYDKDGARLYVVAPMDMIVVQKRTVDDHVGWLLEHEKYEAALTLCEESTRELKAYSTEVCLWERGWERRGMALNVVRIEN